MVDSGTITSLRELYGGSTLTALELSFLYNCGMQKSEMLSCGIVGLRFRGSHYLHQEDHELGLRKISFPASIWVKLHISKCISNILRLTS